MKSNKSFKSILAVIIIFVLIIGFLILIKIPIKKTSNLDLVDTSFIGISGDDINYSNELINEINPKYLEKTKQIIIVSKEEMPRVCKEHNVTLDCYGLSKIYNEPNVIYTGFSNEYKYYTFNGKNFGYVDEMRNVLCHELLHTFYTNDLEDKYGKLTINHTIIYERALRGDCFKNETSPYE